jgi:hypothetical protein
LNFVLRHVGMGTIARPPLGVIRVSMGDYTWTVIPKQSRTAYMAALKAANAQGDIGPLPISWRATASNRRRRRLRARLET